MYKITVTFIETVEEETTEWLRLHNKTDFDSTKEPQYGYVPTKQIVDKELILYTQQILKEIDLKSVIDAFNGR